MIVVDKILGNIERNPIWKERSQKCSVDILSLTQWEAQKSRCRKSTNGGQDLGISIERNQMLVNGDVLLWDETKNTIVIVEIELKEVMVINVSSLATKDPNSILKISFNLGHALGNQHWKAVLKNNDVFIPLTVDKKVMELVLKTHKFDLPFSFVKGETILPHLTHSEARLLFGGAEDSGTHVHVDSDHHHHHDGHHYHSHGAH